jgi:hypothetical protein
MAEEQGRGRVSLFGIDQAGTKLTMQGLSVCGVDMNFTTIMIGARKES